MRVHAKRFKRKAEKQMNASMICVHQYIILGGCASVSGLHTCYTSSPLIERYGHEMGGDIATPPPKPYCLPLN